jgi:uncharacterized protein
MGRPNLVSRLSPARGFQRFIPEDKSMSDIDEVTTPPPSSVGMPSAEERQWAMFAHLSSILAGLVTSFIIGGAGCFLGPMVIWLIKKDTMPFVDVQGKEALNFNILIGIILLALFALTFLTLGIGIIITGPLMFLVGIAWLVFTIIAGIKANNGENYRYPVSLRLVK